MDAIGSRPRTHEAHAHTSLPLTSLNSTFLLAGRAPSLQLGRLAIRGDDDAPAKTLADV